ncbi:MAG: S8 family peptidase [Elusimicrobia bacterium]|nr:S8 family peptidase [Elusimicrobiota bacterium]
MAWVLLLLVLPSFASHVVELPPPERRILLFHDGVSPSQRVAAASAQGRIVRELPIIGAIVVEVDPTKLLAQASPEVRAVETSRWTNWVHEAPAREFALPDLSAIRVQSSALGWPWRRRGPPQPPKPGKDAPEGVKRLKAVSAWLVSKGAGVKVAVIDTGIEATHKDLAPNVKGGWNTIKDNADFKDDHGHGTHVSGTIAAIADGRGVAGVAPEAELYGVKVISKGGHGTTDDVIAGIQWAVDHGMQVINMSIGDTEKSESLCLAVKKARDAGVVVVASAGNDGKQVHWPAACPGALAIAAVDGGNRLTTWSSRGKEVAFIAPGVEVYSCFIGNRHLWASGTSMSAPHVSGAAALVLGAHPGWKAEQAEAAMRSTAFKSPAVPHFWQGSGLPDAEKAVK